MKCKEEETELVSSGRLDLLALEEEKEWMLANHSNSPEISFGCHSYRHGEKAKAVRYVRLECVCIIGGGSSWLALVSVCA